MQIGIVGKPNVGKSTFFCGATLANVEIANYPFTTIKANRGVRCQGRPHLDFDTSASRTGGDKERVIRLSCGVAVVPMPGRAEALAISSWTI